MAVLYPNPALYRSSPRSQQILAKRSSLVWYTVTRQIIFQKTKSTFQPMLMLFESLSISQDEKNILP